MGVIEWALGLSSCWHPAGSLWGRSTLQQSPPVCSTEDWAEIWIQPDWRWIVAEERTPAEGPIQFLLQEKIVQVTGKHVLI